MIDIMDGNKQEIQCMALSHKQYLNTVNTTLATPKQFLAAAASAIPTCFSQLPAVPLIPTNCANSGTFNFNFNLGQTTKISEVATPVVMATYKTDDLSTSKTSPKTSTPGTTIEKPFKCNMCSQQFARRDTLQCHQRTHTGERPYPCDACPLRFARRDTLQCHRRTHTGERRFACDICLQRFARRDTLRCHRRTHSGDKPFACDLCIQRFARRDTLQCHRRTHSGEKPFVCQYCGKRFARTDKLQRHRRTHMRGPVNVLAGTNGDGNPTNCNDCVGSCNVVLSNYAAPFEGDAKYQKTQQSTTTTTTNNNNKETNSTVTAIISTNNDTPTSIDSRNKNITTSNDVSTPSSSAITPTVSKSSHTSTSPCTSQHLHLHPSTNTTLVTPHHHSPHPPQMSPASSIVTMNNMYPQTTGGVIPSSLSKTDRLPTNVSNQLWQIFY